MSEERLKILNMLSEGKIDVEQAEKLLDAVGEQKEVLPVGESIEYPSFLCVLVEPKNKGGERVNVRIPFQLVKAGMKLGALMPSHVQEKIDGQLAQKGVGFKISDIDPKNIEEFMKAMRDFKVNVDTDGERVDIYCE